MKPRVQKQGISRSGMGRAASRSETEASETAKLSHALNDARRRLESEIELRCAVESRLSETAVERQGLYKQLHDGIGQHLTSIAFLLDSLRSRLSLQGVTDAAEINDISQLLNKAIAESRTLAARCQRYGPAAVERAPVLGR